MRRFVFVLLLFANLATAQQIQVNRQNKTIFVSAEGSASLEADVAILTLGCESYGPDEQTTYQQNVAKAEAVLNALEKSGVGKDQLHTNLVRVESVDPEKNWTPEMVKSRRFHAAQSWRIRVQAKDAQTVVDLAMSSGANQVDQVEWAFSDPVKLQAEASGAALKKARRLADEMAKGLDTKLGELVYASNTSPIVSQYFLPGALNTQASMIGAGGGGDRKTKPQLRLYPEKVEQKTTVYAVFAIE